MPIRSEGMRMASGLFGVQVPRQGLRVRIPCPPLRETRLASRLNRVTWEPFAFLAVPDLSRSADSASRRILGDAKSRQRVRTGHLHLARRQLSVADIMGKVVRPRRFGSVDLVVLCWLLSFSESV